MPMLFSRPRALPKSTERLRTTSGFVQRVRQAIEPIHQSKPDWMITTLIAREMGVDFGYSFSATAVFQSDCRQRSGLRRLALSASEGRIESRSGQTRDLEREKISRQEIATIETSGVEVLPDEAEKNTETPKIGHKLHRLTTMTGKTAQFHLLAHGNPKPENLLVSPLVQFESGRNAAKW